MLPRQFRPVRSSSPRHNRVRPRVPGYRPLLEVLEDRLVPASFLVNSILDTTAAGTLRAAILAANANNSGGGNDSITFDPAVFSAAQKILLNGTQLPAITDQSLTITGPAAGVTIDGGHLSGVFQVNAGASASLSGLTITGGQVSDCGGGVYNAGTLTVSACTLSGNTAVSGYGGGIYNSYGNLTLGGSTLAGNSAGGGGGGVASFLSGGGTVALTDDTLSGNNAASYGGGLYSWVCHAGAVTVTDSTFSGGAAYYGGGVFSTLYGGGTFALTGNTLSGNTATQGGGLYSALKYGGTAALADDTVAGNAAVAGGGLFAYLSGSGGAMTLTSSTVAGNAASYAGGGVYSQVTAAGPLTLTDSIVAGNTRGAADDDVRGNNLDPASGYNLIGTGGSGGLANANGNQVGVPPAQVDLAPLGSYGGPTQTLALLPGSPAIDAGTAGPGIPATDQRGLPRAVGATADIGAVESQGVSLAVSGGANQTTPVGTTFSAALAVRVTANYAADPVQGGWVAFTAPTGGATGTFANGQATATASINAAGIATAPVLTANGLVGSYAVTASATGSAATSTFALANTPPAPAGLSATAVSSAQITLTWQDVTGETGFVVQRSPDGSTGWAQVGTTAAGVLTYQDGGLAAGTTYFYRVQATGPAGAGPFSATASAATVVAAPAGLSATAVSSTQITLTWQDVTGETGFVVQRSPDGSTGWTQIGTPAVGVLTYQDSGLSASTTYYYRVQATGAAGAGAFSATASATTSASATPPAPTGLSATAASTKQITLSWHDVTGETGFVVQRSATGTSGWAQVGTPAAGVLTYQDSGLSAGTAYYYRVQATNAAGAGPFSSVVSASTVVAAPAGLSATAVSSSQINLSWHDVAGETGFVVQRSATGTSGWAQIGTTAAGVLSYQDSGLSAGTAYYYRVQATGAAGAGAFSAKASASTVVAAPAGLSATAASSTQIALTWQDVTGETGFVVQRSATGTSGWAQVGTTAAGVLTYQDSGLSSSTTYYYRVQATGAAGAGAFSATASATTPAMVTPPAPTGLSATAVSSTQITLTWNDVAGETGFVVQRSPDGTSGWAQVGTTAAGVLTYQDGGLSAGTTYFYRVQATNAAGAGPFSATASATTLTSDPLNKTVPSQANFTYLGSFLMPSSAGGIDTAYSSGGFTMRYVNGRLDFLATSHVDNGGLVYEVSYPGIGTGANLPTAQVVQNWGDVYTGQKWTSQGGSDITTGGDNTYGLYYDQSTGRLYWNYGWWYEDGYPNDPSLGYSTLNDATGTATGVGAWSLTNRYEKFDRGGMLQIPQWFADQYTGGDTLGVGFGGYYSIISTGSMGPALAAIAEPNISANPDDSALPNVPLLGYPYDTAYAQRPSNYLSYYNDGSYPGTPATAGQYPAGGNPQNGTGYWTWSDTVGGATWIDTPSLGGVLYIAKLGTGDVYYQTSDRHSDGAGQFEWMVYSPADLAAVATGAKQQWQIQPEYEWTTPTLPIGPFDQNGWSGDGSSNVCGVAFDPTTNRLYVDVEGENSNGYEAWPEVYVYQVGPAVGGSAALPALPSPANAAPAQATPAALAVALGGLPGSGQSPVGTAVALQASVTGTASAGAIQYSWTVLKDGAPFAAGSSAQITFIPDVAGTYVVSVTASDTGGDTGTARATLTVTSAAPAAVLITAAPAAGAGAAGNAATLGTDPGAVDPQAGAPVAAGVTLDDLSAT